MKKRPMRNSLLVLILLLVALPAQAQLNCSGGPLNCPGTPTGTGVAVLQTSPTFVTGVTLPAGTASVPSFGLTGATTTGPFISAQGGYSFAWSASGTQRAQFSPNTGWMLSTNGDYGWSSSSTAAAAEDTGLF